MVGDGAGWSAFTDAVLLKSRYSLGPCVNVERGGAEKAFSLLGVRNCQCINSPRPFLR